MNLGTKTRKPRRLRSDGQTTYYQRRKPPLITRIAFATWTIMANTLEIVAVFVGLVTLMLACLIVPLLIWF